MSYQDLQHPSVILLIIAFTLLIISVFVANKTRNMSGLDVLIAGKYFNTAKFLCIIAAACLFISFTLTFLD